MTDTTNQRKECDSVWLGKLEVILKLSGIDTGNAYAMVEHTLQPGNLAAAVHSHCNEDEVSYVIEGTVSALIGNRIIQATPGMLIRKPRNVPHTFWNSGTTPARLLEIIAPAGFEQYFYDVAPLFPEDGTPDLAQLQELHRKYGLELDMTRTMDLLQIYHLTL